MVEFMFIRTLYAIFPPSGLWASYKVLCPSVLYLKGSGFILDHLGGPFFFFFFNSPPSYNRNVMVDRNDWNHCTLFRNHYFLGHQAMKCCLILVVFGRMIINSSPPTEQWCRFSLVSLKEHWRTWIQTYISNVHVVPIICNFVQERRSDTLNLYYERVHLGMDEQRGISLVFFFSNDFLPPPAPTPPPPPLLGALNQWYVEHTRTRPQALVKSS